MIKIGSLHFPALLEGNQNYFKNTNSEVCNLASPKLQAFGISKNEGPFEKTSVKKFPAFCGDMQVRLSDMRK